MDKHLQYLALQAEKSNHHIVESVPKSKMTIPTSLDAQDRPETAKKAADRRRGSKSRGAAELRPSTVFLRVCNIRRGARRGRAVAGLARFVTRSPPLSRVRHSTHPVRLAPLPRRVPVASVPAIPSPMAPLSGAARFERAPPRRKASRPGCATRSPRMRGPRNFDPRSRRLRPEGRPQNQACPCAPRAGESM